MTDIAQHIHAAFADNDAVAAVYLLGSALTGRLRGDSDIDIAILPANRCAISVQERLQVAARLELALGRTIDIGVLDGMNLVYAHEAILKGRRIVTRDINYTDAAETRFLGCYLQLREDRREIEGAYSS